MPSVRRPSRQDTRPCCKSMSPVVVDHTGERFARPQVLAERSRVQFCGRLRLGLGARDYSIASNPGIRFPSYGLCSVLHQDMCALRPTVFFARKVRLTNTAMG